MKTLNKILAFLRTWHEFITLPVAILIWYASPYLLHWIDPTAATFDAGIFQTLLFAFIAVLFFNFCVWVLLKLTFPDVYDYLDNLIEKNLKLKTDNISVWEKSKLALWLFTLYFAALVFIVSRMM